MVIIGIVLVVAVIFYIVDAINPSSEQPTGDIEIHAGVVVRTTEFVVRNQDPFDWENVSLEVNDVYRCQVPLIGGQETEFIPVSDFVKADGTRLDLATTKPSRFFIWCDAPGGKGSWLGNLK